MENKGFGFVFFLFFNQLTFVTSTATEARGYWRIKHDSGHGIYIFSEWQAVNPLGEILQLGVIPVLLLLLLLKFSQQKRPGRQLIITRKKE